MSDDISIPPPGYYNPRHRMAEREQGTYRTAGIALVILAAAGVVALGASVVHYRSGLVPVIEADNRPIKVRPENPGGMQITGANNEILSGGNDTTGSRLAPAPEAPNPQALRAPPPTPAPAPAPLPAAAPVAPPAAAPTTAAVVPPKPKPAPVTTAAAPTPAPAAAHPAAHGRASIQLAALQTEAAARAEWQTLQKRMPSVLAGHEPSISKTERAGKTFWRLRTTGFTDVAQAKAACDQVRAKGNTCSVADF